MVNVLIALKIEIVDISITRDILSHIRGRCVCIKKFIKILFADLAQCVPAAISSSMHLSDISNKFTEILTGDNLPCVIQVFFAIKNKSVV